MDEAERLARRLGQRGPSGIEHVVGIPGMLGGAVVVNGGIRGPCVRGRTGCRPGYQDRYVSPDGRISPADQAGVPAP